MHTVFITLSLCQVFPVDESNYLPPPSPPPKPKLESVAQFSSLPPFVGAGRGRPHSSVSLSTIPEEPTPPSSTTPPGQNLTLFNPFQPQCLQRNGTTFTVIRAKTICDRHQLITVAYCCRCPISRLFSR